MSTYGERYSEHHGDPGQSSSGPARADGYTHGCGKDSSHAHPHHRSVPDMHPSGYNQQRHEGRPDEYEKSYMDQPYHGYNEPPHYSDPRGPYENHSVAGDGSRGLKDMFYKKPPADYSGVYGADYKPEISKKRVTGAVLAGLAIGGFVYSKYRQKQKRREQDYPRPDDYYRGGVTYSDDIRSYGDDRSYHSHSHHRHDYNPYR